MLERRGTLQRRLDRVRRGFLVPLHGHVFGVADLVVLFPGRPGFARHLAGPAVPLGEDRLIVHIAEGPVHVADEALPFLALEQCHGSGPLRQSTSSWPSCWLMLASFQ